MKKVFCYESEETLEEIFQIYWRFFYFGGFLGQSGWSCKQSDVVNDILGHSRGLGTKGDLQVCQCDLGVGEGHVADDLLWDDMAHTG